MKLSSKVQSVLMHIVEAVVVVALSVAIAHFFPDHAPEAFVVAFTALTGLAKGARVSESVPVKDYVNDPISSDRASK